MKEKIIPGAFEKTGFKTSNNPYKRRQIKGERLKEHRRIMQDHIGRKLERWEYVHHINENPLDNRIENLKIVTNQEHGKIHKKIHSSTIFGNCSPQ